MSAIPAAVGSSAYWYLARGTGIVSLLLLTASVVLGILGSLRFAAAPRWPRFAIDTLHRDVSLLVIVLLAAHILTSVLDSFAPIKLTDAVIPFASSYRPLWLGLGALAFDLLLAIVVTSLVRRRLGYQTWRAIHWLAYASWPVAVFHGLGTGSDVKAWWNLALTIACVGAVLIAVWTRIGRSVPEAESVRGPATALSVATVLGLAIFALLGPLRHGWAARAGTPANLLAGAHAAIPAPVRHSRTVAVKRSFSAQLIGSAVRTPAPGGAIVDIALRLSGGTRGRLRIRMAGAPLGNLGLSMTGSQVDLDAVGLPSVMQGQIVSLQDQQFVARVAGTSGSKLDLRADLNIDSQTGRVTGTLSATPPRG